MDGRLAALTHITCAPSMCDMNVTLSIDNRIVAAARRIATTRGTSLNQLIRDYLEELTRVNDVETALDQLDAMWAENVYRSSSPWTREQLLAVP